MPRDGQYVRLCEVRDTDHVDAQRSFDLICCGDGLIVFSAVACPFVAFDDFRFESTVNLAADVPVETPVPRPQHRHDRLPMNGDIIAFP